MNTPGLPPRFRGRFAPSPTGFLHLGNAATALLAWLQAKALGGEWVLRIEDLDASRCRPMFTESIFRDLEYLGLVWDGPVVHQSERTELYEGALSRLLVSGKAYRCACSRADVARAAAAPHQRDDGPIYAGTCRRLGTAVGNSLRSFRFRVSDEPMVVNDLVQGELIQNVAAQVGDIVIADAQQRAGYHLAVVVDDAAQGISHVLRGSDLYWSVPRQRQLALALGYAPLVYAHCGLLTDGSGARLAKREGSFTVTALREQKVDSRRVIALLAKWYGLSNEDAISPSELAQQFELGPQLKPAAVWNEQQVNSLLTLHGARPR